MMPNSYPEWRDFQFAPNNHYGFFFLYTLPSTIAFRLDYDYLFVYVAVLWPCQQLRSHRAGQLPRFTLFLGRLRPTKRLTSTYLFNNFMQSRNS